MFFPFLSFHFIHILSVWQFSGHIENVDCRASISLLSNRFRHTSHTHREVPPRCTLISFQLLTEQFIFFCQWSKPIEADKYFPGFFCLFIFIEILLLVNLPETCMCLIQKLKLHSKSAAPKHTCFEIITPSGWIHQFINEMVMVRTRGDEKTHVSWMELSRHKKNLRESCVIGFMLVLGALQP